MSRDDRHDEHSGRERSHRDRDRERDRSRSRDRGRHSSSKHGDRRRSRSRDRERRRRSRSPDRERGRDRQRRRDGSCSSSGPSSDEGGSRSKRQRTNEPQQQQQQQLTVEQTASVAQQQQQHEQHADAAAAPATSDADAQQQARAAEHAALDAEMEERRRRVEEWRRKRAADAAAAEALKAEQEEQAAAAAAAAAAEAVTATAGAEEAGGTAGARGWSLEDDDDEEDAAEQQQPEDGAAGDDDNDEPDPLDAFMQDNAVAAAATALPPATAMPVSSAEQPQQDGGGAGGGKEEEEEEEEEDPLDAFMAAQVMPEVSRVRWTAPAAAAPAEVPDTSGCVGGVTAVSAGAAAAAAAATNQSLRIVPGGGRPLTPGSGGRRGGTSSATGKAARAARARRMYGSSSSEDLTDSDEEAGEDDQEMDDATWAKNVNAGKLSKGDKLAAVDHGTVQYAPFRRNFYIEVPDVKRMSEAEVAALRKEDGIKVRGKDPPRPIRAWTQSGLSSKVLEVLRRGGFDKPLAIQAQALPIIMSGRDCIGIAKTGSGKTLAFVLPLLRHVKDQPPLESGDGPIALIMAPTRELVQQIAKEVKRFGRQLGLACVAVFGGSGVANQISELKRGAEVVSATPGRLIDLLVSGTGRIINLRRVTYLVMDEADRMFDMGFEPQIMRIVGNIRPDRQTVMFSATFPRSVETLARQVLRDPVEIQVGGRSVVNPDIAQFVEIRPEADRFLRLLEILGEWYEAGKIIIFVHTQDKADSLFRDLLKSGYPCLSLHGGKEQSDRECTIADFKGAVCNILVATSVAARGLDVRELVLVVNYDAPNHHEDYVHRVGRTGRAGNKGTAVTFIGPDEDRYAPDLVKALKESKAPVPQDLQALADAFAAKRKAGLVQGHGSGYGGSGFKFDKDEDAQVRAARKSKAKEFGLVDDEEDDKEKGGEEQEDEDDIRPAGTAAAAAVAAAAIVPAGTSAAAPVNGPAAAMLAAAAAAGAAPVPGAIAPAPLLAPVPAGLLPAGTSQALPADPLAAMRAAAAAAAAAAGGGVAVGGASLGLATAPAAPAAAAPPAQAGGFEAELVVNDFPQKARWKVTHTGYQQDLNELTGAAVTTRGIYVPKGGAPPPGERPLYLLIQAPTEAQVRRAKQELRRVIEEYTEKAMRNDTGASGRYSIV